MRPSRSKAAHLDVAYPRDTFVAVVEQTLSQIGSRAELAAQYLLVSLFWGLVVFCAVAFAVQ
jgi:hypothetical protein